MPPGEQRVNGRLKEAALAQKRTGRVDTIHVRLPCDPPHTMTIEKSSRKGESNPLIGLSRVDWNDILDQWMYNTSRDQNI